VLRHPPGRTHRGPRDPISDPPDLEVHSVSSSRTASYDVSGRTVFITGAARGIGAAAAERLHAKGANVGACSSRWSNGGPSRVPRRWPRECAWPRARARARRESSESPPALST